MSMLIMRLLYILLCLVIIVSISIRLTERNFENFLSYAEYASTKNTKAGDIDILGTSKFSPECCPHTYTTSSGCLCETQNENIIISSRGGNKCFC
tara:strand:+ start:10767 stop:11051 length:285 start_codon:yes stop_codon:yes gene_type:complete